MRHFRNVNAYQRYLVSIHASVKDATTALFGTIERIGVSIHASVKDATLVLLIFVLIRLFQSTHL